MMPRPPRRNPPLGPPKLSPREQTLGQWRGLDLTPLEKGIHKGTLFVTVDSSVWLDEIVRYRRKEILDRLQHSFGRNLVTRISFRVG